MTGGAGKGLMRRRFEFVPVDESIKDLAARELDRQSPLAMAS
jgi:hypothetical protein